MRTKREIKVFEVIGYTINAWFARTRNGFKHEAELVLKGEVLAHTKVCYLNRTWEAWEFETVIRELLLKYFTEKQAHAMLEQVAKIARGEIEKQFRFIGAVAKMGEVLTDNKTDTNKWKKRMLAAGLPLTFPPDWDTLTEEEKERRLDKVIAFAQGKTE